MQIVRQWLEQFGLSQYAGVFAENDIDLEALRLLTDDDLKQLGLSLGHRRKLLKAVAELDATAGSLPVAAPLQEKPQFQQSTRPEAERRQLTVMFCDLVGSTGLSSRLDPEDLRAVIAAYHQQATEVIRASGGFVAQYLGDGVLAYFGYPHAHEDDAERAVRAALNLVDAIANLRPSLTGNLPRSELEERADQSGTQRTDGPLQARVGIATGLVVVGEVISHGVGQEQGVIGETPNLAARLQALAEPNTVVVAASTRRLLGGLFEYRDLGTTGLKGFAVPVQAFQVLRASEVESRFDARHERGVVPLIGREEELELLVRRWRQAQAGETRVVVLTGEAGIGKSRIVRALQDRVADEPHIRLRYFCSPRHQDSALYPFVSQLEQAARFRRQDSDEEKLSKLKGLLAQSNATEEEMALIAGLLSLPISDRLPDMSPQRRKEKTLEALLVQSQRLATRKPLLIVYEDVHWIDPSSLELLTLMVERISGRVLLLITTRPEFTPPWPSHAHVTTITLTRLARTEGAALVHRVTGGRPLPEEVLEQILAHTDGVPLFVEELTKSVLESGLLRAEGERWALRGPLPPLAIPTTLHDSLMARLDRLGPIREIVQLGAALGREFSYELLRALAGLPDPRLQDALRDLVHSELVFCRGTPPNSVYTFKHALVQDVAYATMLRTRRTELHARIVTTLESQFPEIAATQPELLAHHCAEAGLVAQAVDYSLQAGLRAMARSAYREATAQLNRGLDVIAGLLDSPERWKRELDLQVALGGTLIANTGWAALETGAAYRRARELCRQVGDTVQLIPVLWGLFQYHTNRGELVQGQEIAQEFLQVAKQRPQDMAARVISHRVTAMIHLYLGQLSPALSHHNKALAAYDPAERHSPVFFAAVDTRVHSLGWSAWVLLHQGYPNQALMRIREAAAIADELAHPYSSAYALHLTCGVHQFLRDPRTLKERATAQIAIASEQGFVHWLATATIFHGWALTEGGDHAGIAEMHRGLTAMQAAGAQLIVPYYLGLSAGAYSRANQNDEGLRLLADALTRVESTEERWFEPELHRTKGEVLLRGAADLMQAEACFRKALDVARQQGAKWWELRAATSLAQLWRDQGKRAEGQTLLAAVYGWFTEGLDTPDLVQARAVLEELNGIPPQADTSNLL